jgi:imidazolonepropionase-like amidohydrolase
LRSAHGQVLTACLFAVVLCAATLDVSAAPAASDPDPANAPLLLHAGRLVDGTGGAARQDVAVLVRNGRIEQVAAWKGFHAPEGARTVDLTSATLVPGFIDCHVHLTMEVTRGWEIEPVKGTAADAALFGAVSALKTLRAGFTTVRNLGDRDGESVALRNALDRGLFPGPRIVTARRMLSITGGHGDWNNGFRPDLTLAGLRPEEAGICDSPEACVAAVRNQVKYGADVIKISATGGVLSAGDEIGARQFSDEELAAIVGEAHRLGRKVAAHAHGSAGIKAAVKAGVDSIEHGSILDDEAIRLMKEHGTFLVPTLMAGETVEAAAKSGGLPDFAVQKALIVRPKMVDSFHRAVAAGVKIAFGTDSAVSPHGKNAHEFELMVQGGMTPGAALAAGTRVAAELLGREGDIGTIAPGKIADLVAVPGDPLQDVSVLTRPMAVFQAGREVDLGFSPTAPQAAAPSAGR